MKIRFWGTRGSVASPGRETVHYGGNTTCVEVRLEDGSVLILDAGTGIRKLGNALIEEFEQVELWLFVTHTHWDHIQGFPFFRPAFLKATKVHIAGCPSAGKHVGEVLTGQMESAYFPVSFVDLTAEFDFVECPDASWEFGSVRLEGFPLRHPGGGFGVKIVSGGSTCVFLTDNELARPGADQGINERVAEFAREANLLIHDAQYRAEDFPRHLGWGHSCYEDVVRVAVQADVQRLLLTHHDPDRTDDQIDSIVEAARRLVDDLDSTMKVYAAAEGAEFFV
jgi:phosphoribosyl 1,2-cyclic phosphodiesterase